MAVLVVHCSTHLLQVAPLVQKVCGCRSVVCADEKVAGYTLSHFFVLIYAVWLLVVISTLI